MTSHSQTTRKSFSWIYNYAVLLANFDILGHENLSFAVALRPLSRKSLAIKQNIRKFHQKLLQNSPLNIFLLRNP